MKSTLGHLLYFIFAIASTYVVQWVLMLFIGSVRFTAADRPPGDISVSGKLVYVIGFPMFYLLCLTSVFFLYHALLNLFGIEIKRLAPILFNIIIALYLVVRLTLFVFDF